MVSVICTYCTTSQDTMSNRQNLVLYRKLMEKKRLNEHSLPVHKIFHATFPNLLSLQEKIKSMDTFPANQSISLTSPRNDFRY